MNKEYQKKYRLRNRERIKEQQKAWRLKNKDKIREREKTWRAKRLSENPDYYKDAYARDRENNAYRLDEWRKEKNAWKQVSKKATKKIINEYKEKIGCLNPHCCWHGKYSASLLDFHHLEEKSFNIGGGTGLNKPLTKLKTEISKCTLVCSNCHRLITCEKLDIGEFPKCSGEDVFR